MGRLPAALRCFLAPESKTVIRGGIGLFAYNYNEGPNAYAEIGSEFGQSGNLSDGTNGILPVLLLNQNGSVNNQGAGGASINSLYQNAPTAPDSYNGQSVNFAYYHEPLSKIWQYNLEVQRELNPNLVLNVAYVGSHGFDQMFGVDLNQIPENLLGPNDTTGSTNARPFPNYQSIGGNRFTLFRVFSGWSGPGRARIGFPWPAGNYAPPLSWYDDACAAERFSGILAPDNFSS